MSSYKSTQTDVWSHQSKTNQNIPFSAIFTALILLSSIFQHSLFRIIIIIYEWDTALWITLNLVTLIEKLPWLALCLLSWNSPSRGDEILRCKMFLKKFLRAQGQRCRRSVLQFILENLTYEVMGNIPREKSDFV